MRPSWFSSLSGVLMRSFFLLSAAVLALAAPAAAQDGPSHVLSGRDLFALRTATDPQVRPDGGQIAYVRITNDIMSDQGRPSIWLADPATGAQTPLVADDRANMKPAWSPDGSRLAYVVAGGGGPAQLYVRWIATGRSAKVAN